jgi:serine/threonine protein kinase
MGDLRSYFAAGHRPFSETRARSQVAGLLEVLQILHRGRALHRDLTPLNIFVCEGPTLKLGDFGIAMHHVRTGGVAATTMAPWMAPPEVLQQRAQTWRAADDVYQVGQLLAMLVKGEATRKLTSTEVARLPCSDQFKEIVQRCIGPRPKRFASASELTAALKAEPDRATSGRVASLRGLQIVFTGRLDSMTRPDAARRARRAGARVGARVTASTDVVVRGQPSPGQKAGRKGTKLMDVDYYRERGNRIRIINEAAFIRLIRAPGARRS